MFAPPQPILQKKTKIWLSYNSKPKHLHLNYSDPYKDGKHIQAVKKPIKKVYNCGKSWKREITSICLFFPCSPRFIGRQEKPNQGPLLTAENAESAEKTVVLQRSLSINPLERSEKYLVLLNLQCNSQKISDFLWSWSETRVTVPAHLHSTFSLFRWVVP